MKTILGATSAWVIALLVGGASAGCDAGASSDQFDQTQPGEPRAEQPSEPEQPGEPSEELDAEAFEVASVTPLDALPASETPVGVTIDPNGTTRFVLTEESGLYALGDGAATLVFDTNHLPIAEFLPELPFTDVVALSNKRFALTAKNEGYLLDTQDHSLTRFFCYLPPVDDPDDTGGQSISQTLTAQGVAVYQITLAVTHNANLGLLFAHPVTVDSNDGDVYGAEVGAFSDLTGEPLQWSLVPSGKLATAGATGMVVDDSGMVTLARGVDLYSYDGVSVPSLIDSLDRYGVGKIEGLAAVPGTDHILVLDAQLRQLVELAPKI